MIVKSSWNVGLLSLTKLFRNDQIVNHRCTTRRNSKAVEPHILSVDFLKSFSRDWKHHIMSRQAVTRDHIIISIAEWIRSARDSWSANDKEVLFRRAPLRNAFRYGGNIPLKAESKLRSVFKEVTPLSSSGPRYNVTTHSLR